MAILYTIILTAASGCGGGEDVNTRSIAQARRLWEEAGVRDYDLEWQSSGARSGHYLVTVRGGTVREVKSVTPKGEVITARPGDPSYYGVDGLLRTIEEDAEHCVVQAARGPNRGVRVLLRFWPDERFGYPHRYRRDITATLRPLSIDVLSFRPVTAETADVAPEPRAAP